MFHGFSKTTLTQFIVEAVHNKLVCYIHLKNIYIVHDRISKFITILLSMYGTKENIRNGYSVRDASVACR